MSNTSLWHTSNTSLLRVTRLYGIRGTRLSYVIRGTRLFFPRHTPVCLVQVLPAIRLRRHTETLKALQGLVRLSRHKEALVRLIAGIRRLLYGLAGIRRRLASTCFLLEPRFYLLPSILVEARFEVPGVLPSRALLLLASFYNLGTLISLLYLLGILIVEARLA
jgi:hypothetical protein